MCGSSENTNQIIMCHDCDRGYHMYCLDPVMKQIPKAAWYCTACTTVSEGYAFEEGEDHDLDSFKAQADRFRNEWFGKFGKNPDNLAELDLEREFWRLVESPFENLEVEYGADLHSSRFGSGFPSFETHPFEKSSSCPWNLKNLPILQDSLLRFIKQDISGMMIPWVYVGMCFSTFCWHTEDHYTYSINYLHRGSTKTWYGVPSSHADQFEETMRATVPELFEHQPDLLFHLVTLLSPIKLKDHGVRVVRAYQREGEFIVTFPRAYLAGFNQGVSIDWASYYARIAFSRLPL
jgi:hypothetical protein